MQRLMTALGLTTVRSLMVSWAVSAVVLVVGLFLVLAGAGAIGSVFFALGAAATLTTAFFMLRLRAGERADRQTPK